MKYQCAWCKADLDPDRGELGQEKISHGICSLCAIELTRGSGSSAADILEMLRDPVFVVDGDGRMLGANQLGQRMLAKSQDQIVGSFGGDAFECAYAALPGGCGQTVHCLTCGIRNLVMWTLKSGSSFHKVPAFQRIKTSKGVERFLFTVSTERVGERVLLRIDGADMVD